MSDEIDPKNTMLFPPWKELVKVASTWEYGSFHDHLEIALILGVDYGTKEYYSAMTSASDELSSLGRRIVCIHNKGYRVLNPSEYPEAAYIDAKRSATKLKQGINHSYNAPLQQMDHKTQKQMEAITTHLGRTYVQLVSAVTEVKELACISRNQKMLSAATKKLKE